MKRVIGASLGSCVHVTGLLAFLDICRKEGFQADYLGPAVPVDELLEQVSRARPDLVAISYRLSPEAARGLFYQLGQGIRKRGLLGTKFIFGGTSPVAEAARESGIFSRSFDGTEPPGAIHRFLRGETITPAPLQPPQSLVERIRHSQPFPLLRHHFGLPSLDKTVAGAALIAESGELDILSLGPDQNAQEHFFHPQRMDILQEGAGGVPLRKPEDLIRIYTATRRGNFPLLRCYSGTNDLIRWAEMSVETIHNAWGAIPLFWYSRLDGRSKRTLPAAMEENCLTIQWYARRGIPVEINESHQWSLRHAHDTLAVALAYLAAHNAKALGACHYVAQYMFNTPPGTSPLMDLAKMLAKKELIETLVDENFEVFTQVRAGLAHFSPDPCFAKGQLAASGQLSLTLKPQILHVVGFSEGHHVAQPEEIIESCRIIRGVLHDSLVDFPDLTRDPRVQKRKRQLIKEARILLDAIGKIASPPALCAAVESGVLDAPQLKGRPPARGEITTTIIEGACQAINRRTGKILKESTRLNAILGCRSGNAPSAR